MNNNFKQTFEIEVVDLKAGPHECTIIDYLISNHDQSTGLNNIFHTKYNSHGCEHDDVLKIIAYFYKHHHCQKFLGNITIKTYDLNNILVETCTFYDCCPRSVSFGDEVYSSDPIIELNILWNFNYFKKLKK